MVSVSVIMPVYNSEKYVKHAVQSILAQSQRDIQVVLVNDGSKDLSGKICDEIAKKDERVLVIHQQNQGICGARNAGLKVAIGEYITFCDNDDEFLPELIKENYRLAKQYEADVVRFCRRRIVTVNGKTIRNSVMDKFPFLVIKKEEYAKYDYEISCAGNGVWTGLYKRKFIEENKIKFDESMRFGHEDNMFNLMAYEKYNVMVLNPKVYYLWLNRLEHSTTGKFDTNYIESMRKCLKQDFKLAQQYGTIDNQSGTYQSKIARSYVYSLYDYLNLAGKKISIRQKRAILRTFRNQTAFNIGNNYKVLRKDGWFFCILWTLFRYRMYMMPYIAIHVKQKIFNS